MLNVQWVPIGTLKLNPRNARTHKKKQIKQIADSIKAFGWTAPLVSDESNMLLIGHGRYHAAMSLGQKKVPVIVKTGLSDTQKRALAIADNKIASNADWDRAQLAAELGELTTLLPECNLDLQITGFEAIDRLEEWRCHYNHDRPHTSLGNLTPNEFARQTQIAREIA